jgi:hypothetical protein
VVAVNKYAIAYGLPPVFDEPATPRAEPDEPAASVE